MKQQIVITIFQGFVNNVFSDADVDVVVLDYDSKRELGEGDWHPGSEKALPMSAMDAEQRQDLARLK